MIHFVIALDFFKRFLLTSDSGILSGIYLGISQNTFSKKKEFLEESTTRGVNAGGLLVLFDEISIGIYRGIHSGIPVGFFEGPEQISGEISKRISEGLP